MDEHEDLGDLVLSVLHLLASREQLKDVGGRLLLILSQLVLRIDVIELPLQ